MKWIWNYFDYCTCMGGFKLLILFSFLFPLPIPTLLCHYQNLFFSLFYLKIWFAGRPLHHFQNWCYVCCKKKNTFKLHLPLAENWIQTYFELFCCCCWNQCFKKCTIECPLIFSHDKWDSVKHFIIYISTGII